MAQLSSSSNRQPPMLRIGPFGGIDLSLNPAEIDQNHSPDMLNFNIDERGSLNKRTGYERIYPTSLGAGAINGVFEYRKKDGTIIFLLAHGTKLYKQSGSDQPVEIYNGIANQKINFFSVKDKCYIMDGVQMLVFDGITAKAVEPYIPTLAVSKQPSGGGTKLEDFNLLGAGFKDSFSANGVNLDFHLSLNGLDDTPVKAEVNNAQKVEGVDFEVDRKRGIVKFFQSFTPPEGTNNVVITAYKTIGDQFTNYFTGDGANKVFVLSRQELDPDPVIVTLGEAPNLVTWVEGTDFTVDREKGIVTMNVAPLGDPTITAYKRLGNFKKMINQCRFSVFYGGSNDTRAIIGGNPDFPNQIWRSGLEDPTYWPENGFYKVGSDSDKVQGFSKQYDYLVIHKEYTLWNMQYELINGEPSFPIKPINDQVGTTARHSIQIIENNPVSLSKQGIYSLVASNVRDERNVQFFSDRVDPKLLKESNLQDAVSIDFDKKYWLAVNGNVYIYDYVIKQWYIYDNINASCFIERDGELYFGSSLDGIVYKFKKNTHAQAFTDDGQPINAYWVSKLFDFGVPEYLKVVQKLFFNLKPNAHTGVDVYYRTDRKGESFVLSTRMDKITFNFFDFTRFSFITSDIPQEMAKKVKLKKINYLQLKLVNDKIDEGLGIINLSIKYGMQNEVK